MAAIVTGVYKQFLRGLIDATVKVPEAVTVALMSGRIRAAALKCVVLNGVLLLGSMLTYNLIIVAILAFAFGINTSDPSDGAIVGSLLALLYTLLWVYPVFGLSFLLNSIWHQEIADEAQFIRRTQLKLTADVAPTTPQRTKLKQTIVDDLYRALMGVVFLSIAGVMWLIPFVGIPLAFAKTAWMYSMYSFEYKWIAEGWPLEARLKLIEKDWAYFLGFGFPTTLLTFFLPTVASNAIFAMLFPLYIVTATLTTPPPVQRGFVNVIPHVPVFAIANLVTELVLRQVPSLQATAAAAAGVSADSVDAAASAAATATAAATETTTKKAE
ncbi:etoposide-induced protein 2.4-domain-containing protein [Blastocladiella britannica]|nr:etoposide-induced protein 2.4-domain-containing protein [Blastocladiella britannica]